MRARIAMTLAVAAALGLGPWAADRAAGNGGPFVVKYPSGDPAAKGVLARLDPTLKPARETRLRVVKEDLSVQFNHGRYYGDTTILPPLAAVTAAYTIENPTGEEVQVDFGFPILRGIYMRSGMVDTPVVGVTVDKEYLSTTVISNSLIYGMIRDHSRQCIDKGIAGDAELARLVQMVRDAHGIVPGQPAKDETTPAVQPLPQAQQAAPAGVKRPSPEAAARARAALQAHLVTKLKWNERDAALMVEYASLNFSFGPMYHWPRDRWDTSGNWSMRGDKANGLLQANLGPLAAIGEQKATQFFAQLASRFDKDAASTYESIFTAWGGEVRERSVDLASGIVRPRELSSVSAAPREGGAIGPRRDGLRPARLHRPERQAAARAEGVVRNGAPQSARDVHLRADEPAALPVKFPAKATRLVTITYLQYAYTDTASPASYQLAYVLHPASLWQEFGPINLTVRVPKGIACKASAAVAKAGEQEVQIPGVPNKVAMDVYTATLTEAKQKRGELFIGIDRGAWDEQAAAAAEEEAKKREATKTNVPRAAIAAPEPGSPITLPASAPPAPVPAPSPSKLRK